MKIHYNVLIGIEDDKELKLIATMPFYEKRKTKPLKTNGKFKIDPP